MTVPVVTPISGEPLRFFVRSRTVPGLKYLVDVEEDFCGCQDHEFRKTRCWHLRTARDFLLDDVIRRITAVTNPKENYIPNREATVLRSACG